MSEIQRKDFSSKTRNEQLCYNLPKKRTAIPVAGLQKCHRVGLLELRWSDGWELGRENIPGRENGVGGGGHMKA